MAKAHTLALAGAVAAVGALGLTTQSASADTVDNASTPSNGQSGVGTQANNDYSYPVRPDQSAVEDSADKAENAGVNVTKDPDKVVETDTDGADKAKQDAVNDSKNQASDIDKVTDQQKQNTDQYNKDKQNVSKDNQDGKNQVDQSNKDTDSAANAASGAGVNVVHDKDQDKTPNYEQPKPGQSGADAHKTNTDNQAKHDDAVDKAKQDAQNQQKEIDKAKNQQIANDTKWNNASLQLQQAVTQSNAALSDAQKAYDKAVADAKKAGINVNTSNKDNTPKWVVPKSHSIEDILAANQANLKLYQDAINKMKADNALVAKDLEDAAAKATSATNSYNAAKAQYDKDHKALADAQKQLNDEIAKAKAAGMQVIKDTEQKYGKDSQAAQDVKKQVADTQKALADYQAEVDKANSTNSANNAKFAEQMKAYQTAYDHYKSELDRITKSNNDKKDKYNKDNNNYLNGTNLKTMMSAKAQSDNNGSGQYHTVMDAEVNQSDGVFQLTHDMNDGVHIIGHGYLTGKIDYTTKSNGDGSQTVTITNIRLYHYVYTNSGFANSALNKNINFHVYDMNGHELFSVYHNGNNSFDKTINKVVAINKTYTLKPGEKTEQIQPLKVDDNWVVNTHGQINIRFENTNVKPTPPTYEKVPTEPTKPTPPKPVMPPDNVSTLHYHDVVSDEKPPAIPTTINQSVQFETVGQPPKLDKADKITVHYHHNTVGDIPTPVKPADLNVHYHETVIHVTPANHKDGKDESGKNDANGKTFVIGDTERYELQNDKLVAGRTDDIKNYQLVDNLPDGRVATQSSVDKALKDQNLQDSFTAKVDGQKVTYTATDAYLKKMNADKAHDFNIATISLPTTVTKPQSVKNQLQTIINGHTLTSNLVPNDGYQVDPDKHFITEIDENGNTKVTDGTIYVAGDNIQGSVSAKLPSNLSTPMTNVQLKDDYRQYSQYVKYQSAKVFENGKDVTNQYTITDNGGIITATRKDASKAPQGATVELRPTWVISHDVPNDSTFVNKGEMTVNKDTEKTPDREVYLYKPSADKHFVNVVDENGHHSTVSTDNMTYVVGDDVSAEVSATLPDSHNMSTPLSNVTLKDDFSKYANYVTVKNTKVYENGKDVTNQYNISVDAKGTVTATRKDASKAPTGKVSLLVTFTINHQVPNGFELVNNGSLTVNKDTVPTPPVDVVVYKPSADKHFVNVIDKNGHETVQNTDGLTYVAGDKVFAQVNGNLPKRDDLANKLTNVTIKDDFSKYADQVGVDKVTVLENGKDVTNLYNVTVDAKGTVTATRTDAAGAPSGTVSLRIQFSLKHDVKNGFKLENDGSLQVNTDTVPTPPVDVTVFKPAANKHFVWDNAGHIHVTDDKSYVAGDEVQTQVHGTLPDPDKLANPLNKVEIKDDYSQFAKYATLKDVKVFENGVDVTDQYTLSYHKGYVTATRKDPSKAPGGELILEPTWVISKTTPDNTTFTNHGEFTVNTDTVPTNDPNVYVHIPKADKHFTTVVDENGHKTTVNTDGLTYVTGDDVTAEVNGHMISSDDAAKPFTHVEVTDDFSAYKDYVSVKDVHVFENGKDVTDQYNISDGANSKITATRKAPHGAPGGDVKLVVTFTIKKNVPNGFELKNNGKLTVNQYTQPTPPVEVTVYKPSADKHFITVVDKDGKETVKTTDGMNYVAGDSLTAQVDGKLPDKDKLANKLTNITIKDDFSKYAQYVTVQGATVFENGKDVTDQYTITISNGVATAVRKDASKAPSGTVSLRLQFTVNHDVPDGTDLVNNGSLQVNKDTVPTPPVDVHVYKPSANKHFVIDENGKVTVTDNKVYVAGDTVQANVEGKLPDKDKLANPLNKVVLKDDYRQFSKNAKYQSAKVFENGKDVTNLYTIVDKDGIVTATRKDASSTPSGKVTLQVKWTVSRTIKDNTVFTNAGSLTVNTDTVPTNTPNVYVYKPSADKHWTEGKNITDNAVYTAGDNATATVNGTLPDKDKLAHSLDKVQIYDDYTKFSDHVKFNGAQVLENGKDVTDQYTIVDKDGVVTATRKDASKAPSGKLQLVVNWIINNDTKKDTILTNQGGMTINKDNVRTNTPKVTVWQPTPIKDVELGTVIGDTPNSIDKTTVVAGDTLTYPLSSDNLPAHRAKDITSHKIVDKIPDGTQYKGAHVYLPQGDKMVDVTDLYDIKVDGQTVTFTAKKGMLDKMNADKSKEFVTPIIDLSVVVVAHESTDLKNSYDLYLNNSKTTSNEVVNHTPSIKPVKSEKNELGDNIDGKNVSRGDHLHYSITWDLSDMKGVAVDADTIAKGMSVSDDYDETRINADKDALVVVDQDGNTIDMSMVDIKWDDKLGQFVVSAKDPQAFLDKYAGQKLSVEFYATVKNDANGVLKNTAIQHNFGQDYQTNTTSNDIPNMNPSKDVTVNVADGHSMDGKNIDKGDIFNYQLNSSDRPANYGGNTDEWSISDKLDIAHDRYTGQWIVHTNHDITLADGTVLHKGDDITKYFTATYDSSTGQFKLTMNKELRDIINSDVNKKTAQGWSAWVQVERTAYGDVDNTFEESYNNEIIKSNTVTTHTPEPAKPTPESPKTPDKPVTPKVPKSPAKPVNTPTPGKASIVHADKGTVELPETGQDANLAAVAGAALSAMMLGLGMAGFGRHKRNRNLG